MKKEKVKTMLIVLIIAILCLNIGVYAATVISATDVTYTKPGETTPISVKDALDELRAGLPTKSIGDEVSLKNYPNEKFYVLEWDNNSDVALLMAKYNLNQAGDAQQDAAYGTTACAFSSTNYWSSEASYPLNLNDYYGYSSNDALAMAKNYGRIKGAVSSRLLSYEEANALKTKASSDPKIDNMLWGKANSANKFLFYWLGSAKSTRYVWYVRGSVSDLRSSPYSISSDYGVRPVITVLKSNIS